MLVYNKLSMCSGYFSVVIKRCDQKQLIAKIDFLVYVPGKESILALVLWQQVARAGSLEITFSTKTKEQTETTGCGTRL